MKKKILSLLVATTCVVALFAGCGSKTDTDTNSAANKTSDGDHPVITMNAPYRNMAAFYDLVHEKYPEVNLEIIPYNGWNTTAWMIDMRKSGQMTDIYFSSMYSPGRSDDEADFLDLGGYDFTDNFVQSRLREVTYDGGVYMLPLSYNALGITYNRTLLEENGWELPQSLAEMEELKTKAEAAGYTLCSDMFQFPGFGFQYLCNIADTGYLSSIEGIKWQNKFVNGEANVSDTPEMEKSVRTLERWRDLGLLNGNGTPRDDAATREKFAEGNTLFLLGNSADFRDELKVTDKYGLMPYLSEDGKHNVYILNVSRYVGLNKRLGDKGNEKKLEDVLKVMNVLSTVEGIDALDPGQSTARLLSIKDAPVNEDGFYGDIMEELNSGHTAPFIYVGWENAIVPIGEKLIDYACGKTDIEDVISTVDDSQKLITEDEKPSYTVVTETIGLEDCARAVGIAFAQATDSEAALISTNPWVYDKDSVTVNGEGVSGCLFPLPVADDEIVSVIPTGWTSNISTVTLTGARIKELAENGFDANGNGITYPYILVTKGNKELDDNTTYTIPICGATDDLTKEGNLQDSGILGLDAARNYFKQYETFSAKDIRWE